MAGFHSNEDVYADPSAWTPDDCYGCFRWLSRLVAKAPEKEFYRDELVGLRVAEMNHPAQVMLKALLEEVPASKDLIDDAQRHEIDCVGPLHSPLVLSDNGALIPRYAELGLIL